MKPKKSCCSSLKCLLFIAIPFVIVIVVIVAAFVFVYQNSKEDDADTDLLTKASEDDGPKIEIFNDPDNNSNDANGEGTSEQ